MTEIRQQGSRSESTLGENPSVKCRAAVSAKTGDQRHRLAGILDLANGVITKVDVTVEAVAGKDEEPPRRR